MNVKKYSKLNSKNKKIINFNTLINQNKKKGIFLNKGFYNVSHYNILKPNYDSLQITNLNLLTRVFSNLTSVITLLIQKIKTFCEGDIIKLLSTKLYKYNFNKYDIEEKFNSDLLFQLKIIKILLNNRLCGGLFNKINASDRQKLIGILDYLINVRNSIAHLEHKKNKNADYDNIEYIGSKNSCQTIIKKCIVLFSFINNLFDISNIMDKKIYKMHIFTFHNIYFRLEKLYIINERRKRFNEILNKRKDINLKEMSLKTIQYLKKNLSSNNIIIRENTVRSIINFITILLENDELLKSIDNKLSTKEIMKTFSSYTPN
jgi:hypothetical protein